MIRRLVFLLVTSLASYGGFYLIYRVYLSDIVPVASSEGTQSLLRFETAFILTAIMWVSLAVAALTTIFIVLLLVRQAQCPQGTAAVPPWPRRKVPGSGLR
jgi:hypothetical protein